jgi:hypothetical protein
VREKNKGRKMFKKQCPSVRVELNDNYREDHGPYFFKVFWDSDLQFFDELEVEMIDSGFQVFFKYTQWTVLHTRIIWHRDDKAEGRVQVTIIEVDQDEASLNVRPKVALASKGDTQAEIKSLGTAKIKIENFCGWLEKQLNEAIARRYVEWFGDDSQNEFKLGESVRVFAVAHAKGQPDEIINGDECEIVGIGGRELLVSYAGRSVCVDVTQCQRPGQLPPARNFQPGEPVGFFLNPFLEPEDEKSHIGVLACAATVVRQEGESVAIRLTDREDDKETHLLPIGLLWSPSILDSDA